MADWRAKVVGIIQLILIMGASATLASQEEDHFRQCSMTSATRASRRFSYTLYKIAAGINSPRKNILLSPIAAGMSLSMLSSGATGITRKQMIRALEQPRDSGSSMDTECLLAAYHGIRFNKPFLFKDTADEIGTARLRTATRVYGEQNLTFSDDFVENTGRYGLEMAVVPFAADPREAERRINAWVRDQSQGYVRQIIPPGSIRRGTTIVLTCMIYFKGTWATTFTNTTQGYFYLFNGRRRGANFMESRGPLRHISSGILEAELTEIPYASPDGSNIDVSLILILPFRNTSCREVERRLSDESILELMAQNASDHISVKIPKFTLFGEHKLRLFLKRMGVRLVFSSRNAKFPLAVGPEEGKRPKVSVSNLYHKAHFEIDEFGTRGDSLHQSNAETDTQAAGKRILKHDRSFIFLLYDKFTDSIIYAGRMADPSQKSIG